MQIHGGSPCPPASPRGIGEPRERRLGRDKIDNWRPTARGQKKWGKLVALDSGGFVREKANYRPGICYSATIVLYMCILLVEEWHVKCKETQTRLHRQEKEIGIMLL